MNNIVVLLIGMQSAETSKQHNAVLERQLNVISTIMTYFELVHELLVLFAVSRLLLQL